MADSSWFKGNLHAHTTESDGDSPPRKVVEWYRDHGFDWVALTDHNTRTVIPPEDAPDPSPLVLTGEEVTVEMPGQEKVVVVQGVGISKVIEPTAAEDVFGTVQARVNAIVEAGGVPCLMVHHDMAGFRPESIKDIDGAPLLEIYNVKATMDGPVDPSVPSYEDIWDLMLTSGKIVYGVAVDDAHHFKEFGPEKVNPGGAWVMVRAAELLESSIISSLTSGDFYASTGVELQTLETIGDGIAMEISPAPGETYRTAFVGSGGAQLDEQSGNRATYRPNAGDGYARAVVSSSSGSKAWTQPVFEG